MNNKFFDLKKEKQDRMINAALKVFAIYGFNKASTDDIVREAGISKGLLFHYFESKKGTYQFMYEYSARYYSMELERSVTLREHDLFKIMAQVEDVKCGLLSQYPYMLRFMLTYDNLDDEEFKASLASYEGMIPAAMKEIYDRVDLTKIREGVDKDLLIRSLEYTTRGLMEEAVDKELSPDDVRVEMKAYLKMMAQAFNKEQ